MTTVVQMQIETIADVSRVEDPLTPLSFTDKRVPVLSIFSARGS